VNEIDKPSFIQAAARKVRGHTLAVRDQPVDVGKCLHEDQPREAVVPRDVREGLYELVRDSG
jgi:hypothetical protein